MISSSEVIHGYAQLASTVSRMAVLARARQWGQLPELEDQCDSVVDELKHIEPLDLVDLLDSPQRQAVQHLLIRIREDQEEMRRLIQPQLDRLMADLQMQNNIGPANYGLLH